MICDRIIKTKRTCPQFTKMIEARNAISTVSRGAADPEFKGYGKGA